MLADLRAYPITVDEAVVHVSEASAGAIAVFIGVVRDHNQGRPVVKLEYQAYPSMARAELGRIAAEVEAGTPGVRVAVLHRTGSLTVGETAVVCAASAPHRAEAFAATRRLIEEIKTRVPIWKREHGPGGAVWVGWVDARCGDTVEHRHEHPHPRGG